MKRQLPPTITADQTPDWLPAGWMVHSTTLKRGRQTRTYTQLGTGKKFSTKDQVLEHIKMEEIRDKRESGIEKIKAWLNLKATRDRDAEEERPSWLPDGWEVEPKIGSDGNPYMMYVNKSSGIRTYLKEAVLWHSNNTMESQAVSSSDGEKEEETSCNEIAYMIDESEEDLSENEYFEKNVANFSTSVRSQPERMQKLDSRAKTQCVFEDEEMSSDGEKDDKLCETETSKEENASGEARVVSNLPEDQQNLHDVVFECDDKATGLTGTFSIEINIENEPGFVEKDSKKSETEGIGGRRRNIEIINLDSDSDSSMVVEVKNKKSEESAQEETGNEARRSVLYPCGKKEANNSSKARSSSAGDNINTVNELGLEENIDSSKKKKNQKKIEELCSSSSPSKNIKKKKDIEEERTEKSKGKRPQRKKRSSSVVIEERKENIDWPEPNPNFLFQPITNRFRYLEDDSVICKYLEQHNTAASESGDCTLPDFGLLSFADIKISKDEEEHNESKKEKKKPSLDPPRPPAPAPRVQFGASSSSSLLPSCSYMSGTTSTMQQTVAGTSSQAFSV